MSPVANPVARLSVSSGCERGGGCCALVIILVWEVRLIFTFCRMKTRNGNNIQTARAHQYVWIMEPLRELLPDRSKFLPSTVDLHTKFGVSPPWFPALIFFLFFFLPR